MPILGPFRFRHWSSFQLSIIPISTSEFIPIILTSELLPIPVPTLELIPIVHHSDDGCNWNTQCRHKNLPDVSIRMYPMLVSECTQCQHRNAPNVGIRMD